MARVITRPRFLSETKSVFYVLSTGINKYNNERRSIHAENNAISRLKKRNTRKKRRVNILVIKTSKTGILGNSKPCYHCLMDLQNLSPSRGYKINNVFYSDVNGEIKKTKLSHLISEGDFHFSAYYKNLIKNNKKNKK